MTFRITSNELIKQVNDVHYANDGDYYERTYWALIKERFPNCEIYWKYFIVPATKRIELPLNDQRRLNLRDGISKEIQQVSTFHYTIFVNLIYAHNHLRNFTLSSFEDFYIHLASACDLTENFLLKIFILICESKRIDIKSLQNLSKDEFLDLASDFYDKYYKEIYDECKEIMKYKPIYLPDRKNILNEYFKDQRDWVDYKKFTQALRAYRNVFIHDAQMGKLFNYGGILLVPRIEKIDDYKNFNNILSIKDNVEIIKSDFIEMREQMALNIGKLEKILNCLWKRVIEDINQLFYVEKNEILLDKFCIDLE